MLLLHRGRHSKHDGDTVHGSPLQFFHCHAAGHWFSSDAVQHGVEVLGNCRGLHNPSACQRLHTLNPSNFNDVAILRRSDNQPRRQLLEAPARSTSKREYGNGIGRLTETGVHVDCSFRTRGATAATTMTITLQQSVVTEDETQARHGDTQPQQSTYRRCIAFNRLRHCCTQVDTTLLEGDNIATYMPNNAPVSDLRREHAVWWPIALNIYPHFF